MKKNLPINEERLAFEQARGTIKSILDAIVELVTNSDDSFSKMGDVTLDPEIKIAIKRKTGGLCEFIKVIDNAAGMTYEELLKAIEFAGLTSGFMEGKKVRGFLGRGLKESIIALGNGYILTKKNGKVSGVKIWLENTESSRYPKPFYEDLNTAEIEKFCEDINKFSSGTVVYIDQINDYYKINDVETLYCQIRDHYQLRGINSNPNRKVILEFHAENKSIKDSPIGRSLIRQIIFTYPKNKIVQDENIKVDRYKEMIRLKINESITALDSPSSSPFGLAGILIKTEGAILDNRLFRYDNNPSGLYFFGEVEIPGIAARLRNKEMLVSPNRTGLDWKDPYLAEIRKVIEDELLVHVENKSRELELSTENGLSDTNKRLVDRLRELMNSWAKEEGIDMEAPIDPKTLDRPIIKPEVCQIEIDTPRTMSIYVPVEISEVYPLKDIKIMSDNDLIDVDFSHLEFIQHKNYKDILVGTFTVQSRHEGEEGIITAEIGEFKPFSIISVVEKLTHRKIKKRKLTGKTGGFLREIRPDPREEPKQRVSYEENIGEIRVYTKFPGVRTFLGNNLERVETDQGLLLLSELITEIFCRVLVRNGLESGKFVPVRDDIDAVLDCYHRYYFELQNKYTEKLYQAIKQYYKK